MMLGKVLFAEWAETARDDFFKGIRVVATLHDDGVFGINLLFFGRHNYQDI